MACVVLITPKIRDQVRVLVLTKSWDKRSNGGVKRKSRLQNFVWTPRSGYAINADLPPCVLRHNKYALLAVLVQPMTDPLRRKLFFFLIGTLNSVFIHEHDFRYTRSHKCKHSTYLFFNRLVAVWHTRTISNGFLVWSKYWGTWKHTLRQSYKKNEVC